MQRVIKKMQTTLSPLTATVMMMTMMMMMMLTLVMCRVLQLVSMIDFSLAVCLLVR